MNVLFKTVRVSAAGVGARVQPSIRLLERGQNSSPSALMHPRAQLLLLCPPTCQLSSGTGGMCARVTIARLAQP